MKPNFLLVIAATTLCTTTAAYAAGVDMKDPRRALALDDDLRIDAQLADDAIGSGSSVNVTFQIQNNTRKPVAIANKVSDSSYDPESQTVTISIGSEIPNGATMPHLSIVKAGETRTFTTAAMVHVVMPTAQSPFVAYPRYVQVQVNVLRDIAPFNELIARQRDAAQPPLPDSLFETWVQNNDAIFLNAIPVHWKSGRAPGDQNGADLASPIRTAGGTF
jgi:hypothetical protein